PTRALGCGQKCKTEHINDTRIRGPEYLFATPMADSPGRERTRFASSAWLCGSELGEGAGFHRQAGANLPSALGPGRDRRGAFRHRPGTKAIQPTSTRALFTGTGSRGAAPRQLADCKPA